MSSLRSSSENYIYRNNDYQSLDKIVTTGGNETSLPDKLVGDQVRLQQVLINLTKNALKFTHRGRITIWVAYDYN